MTERSDSFSPSLMYGENKMPSVRRAVSLARGRLLAELTTHGLNYTRLQGPEWRNW